MVPSIADMPTEMVYVREYPICLMAYPNDKPPNPKAAPSRKANNLTFEGDSFSTVTRSGTVNNPIITGMMSQAKNAWISQ